MAYAQENGLHNYHNEVNLGRENRWLKKGPEGKKGGERGTEIVSFCYYLYPVMSTKTAKKLQ